LWRNAVPSKKEGPWVGSVVSSLWVRVTLSQIETIFGIKKQKFKEVGEKSAHIHKRNVDRSSMTE